MYSPVFLSTLTTSGSPPVLSISLSDHSFSGFADRTWRRKRSHRWVPMVRMTSACATRRFGRSWIWQQESGDHQWKLVKTSVFCDQALYGDKLRTRKLANQFNEMFVKCALLNRMTQLGCRTVTRSLAERKGCGQGLNIYATTLNKPKNDTK